MPRYLHQFSYTTESLKAMTTAPSDRRAAAEKLMSAAGGKLLDLYYCFGEYDGIAISEFPANVDVAAGILAAGASGGFSQMKTTVLITMDEAKEAMEKAGKAAASYTPPAG